jgi:LacI family gluconate utilization system Gnt-I transcriptional repressor
MAGYKQAMEAAGLPIENRLATLERPSSVSAGTELISTLLDRGAELEALFCGDDNLALGALFECQRRGIAVPEQMSLIGFNDLEFSACVYPSLSSVSTPRYEMGRLSAEIIMRIVETGERPANSKIDVGFSIKKRQSTTRRGASGLTAAD